MDFKAQAQSAQQTGGFSLGKGCLIFFAVLAILWIGSWAVGASLWGMVFGPSQEIAETAERLIRVSTPQGEYPFIIEDGDGVILMTGGDGVQVVCKSADDLDTCVPFVNAQGATLSDNEPTVPEVDVCLDGLGGTTCHSTGKPRAARSYKPQL